MNAQKLQRRLQWYQITGHSVDDMERSVVAFVQATSRRKVLRYHGGRRKELFPGGTVIVEFPTEQGAVQLLGKRLKPERLQAASDSIVEVIPVTRYRCECGEERVSEYPYPSMWCGCGKMVLPL